MKNKDTQLLEEAYVEAKRKIAEAKQAANEPITVNIPREFVITTADTPAAYAVFDFLRWQCGLDFKTRSQGSRQSGGYETTFTYKGPFTKHGSSSEE